MGLMAKEPASDKEFQLTPQGAHVARCYAVVDLGNQQVEWQGQIKIKRKVRVSWELPGELMEDGRPFSISQNYTLSLSDKARLYKDLVSWRGKQFTAQELEGFDLFNVLGAPCLINVIHNVANDGKTYANVSSISPLPKGMECPPRINDTLKFSLDEFDPEIYEALPDWLKGKINRELVEAPKPIDPPTDFDEDDQIPF